MKAKASSDRGAFVRILVFWAIGLTCAGPAYSQPTLTLLSDESSVYGNAPNGPSGGVIVNADDAHKLLFRSFGANIVSDSSGIGAPLFLRDRKSNSTILLAPGENLGGYALSPEGQFAAYVSGTSLFLYEVETTVHTRIATVPAGSSVSLSAMAQYVVFESESVHDLFPSIDSSATQIVRWDRNTQAYLLVSGTETGAPGNNDSYSPRTSRSGHVVGFVSDASNLVNGDSNQFADAFAWRESGTTLLASQTVRGDQPDSDVAELFLSANGDYLAFTSTSPLLLPEPLQTTVRQAYVYRLLSNELIHVSTQPDGRAITEDNHQPTVADSGSVVTFYQDRQDFDLIIQKNSLFPAPLTEINEQVERIRFGYGVFFATTANGSEVFYTANPTRLGGCGLLGGPASCLFYIDNIYRHDMMTSAKTVESLASEGSKLPAAARAFTGELSASEDGRFVSARWRPHNADNRSTVTYLDRLAGSFSSTFGIRSDISPDGRFLLYFTRGISGSIGLSLWDTVVGGSERLSPTPLNIGSLVPALVDEFAELVFTNGLNGLDVYNRISGVLESIGSVPDDVFGPRSATLVAINPSGRFVLFYSRADLSGAGSNGRDQLFLYDRQLQTTLLVSRDAFDAPLEYSTTDADLSDSADRVLFRQTSPDIVEGQVQTFQSRIFLRWINTDQTIQVSPELGVDCTNPSLSSDGNNAVFICDSDVYVYNVLEQRSTIALASDSEVRMIEAEVIGSETLYMTLGVSRGAPFRGLPGDLASTFQAATIALDDAFFDTVFRNSFEAE